MAPTDGRVAKPERRWGCRRGTPRAYRQRLTIARILDLMHFIRCKSALGDVAGEERFLAVFLQN